MGRDSLAELAAAPQTAVGVATHAADDELWETGSVLAMSMDLIEAGLFEGSFSEPAPISFNEVRLLMGRIDPERSSAEAYGLGVELSAMMGGGLFGELGFWVLDQEGGKEREVGRMSIGLGYAAALGARTAGYVRAGLDWERGRKNSVNFFSFVHDDKTLFGGDDNELGVTGELGVRHRAAKHLEIAGGVLGETLRKDSAGWFAGVRVFLTKNTALHLRFEDTDEELVSLAFNVVF